MAIQHRKYSPVEIMQTFQKVIQHNKDRLEFGLLDRERIKAQIENGERPTGYRVKAIMEGSSKIIELLSEISINFNQSHSKDRMSNQDFIDILLTAIQKIKDATS